MLTRVLLVLPILVLVGCGYSLGDFDILDPEPDPFSSEAFNFAIIGDWGRDGWFRQDNVAEVMGRTCKRIGCRFVVSTGDNFYVDGVESVDDSNWRDSFEEVYTAPSLQVPWYVVLGNHDYLGDIQAQIDYTGESERWMLPSRYYSVEFQIDDTTTALFAFLDTVPLVESVSTPDLPVQEETDADVQIAWLDSTLRASAADFRFVVGHHPVISASAKHRDSPVLQKRVQPVLRRHRVDAYISGHVHSLQHLRQSGDVDYIVSGGGSLARTVGSHPSVLFAAGVSGFSVVSLTPSRVELQFIDYKGSVGYEAVLRDVEETPPA